VHDPFLVLDENFQPQLRPDGMPRLMHSKNNTELDYTEVLHPNKDENISADDVKRAIASFSTYAPDIRNMTEVVQETTLETYGEIGRLNADGKIEVGFDKN
jgi:phosphoribosylaminoimidazole-succinocarboxamide synthase